MNKIFLLALAASTFMLVACGDDDSGFEGAKTSWDYLNPGIDYGEFTDARDGQRYKTVKIGDQTWMAENRNYSVNPDVQSWCGGGSRETVGDCSKYGRLYTWAAAVDACPEGWRLPSKTEWRNLFNAVGGSSVAGQKLKVDSDLRNRYDGISNDDSFGFSALSAGYRYLNGYFIDAGSNASSWSASQREYDSYSAYSMYLNYDIEDASLWGNDKYYAFSVRCVKN